jgi:hypothetical protein
VAQNLLELRAEEAIGGYWIIQVPSREGAIERATRAPMADNEIIEVRQIFETGDVSAAAQKDVQKATESFAELKNATARRA